MAPLEKRLKFKNEFVAKWNISLVSISVNVHICDSTNKFSSARTEKKKIFNLYLHLSKWLENNVHWILKNICWSLKEQKFESVVVVNLGPVWINLFEFIYWYKHLRDCLGELTETTYDMSISCVQHISISFPSLT
jgi:hypothetical protein